jgi:hypothetical protein
MDAEDLANDRMDIVDPKEDSLKHEVQFVEPTPSMPCIEYNRLDSLVKLRRDILELTASVLRKLAAPRELHILRTLRELPIPKKLKIESTTRPILAFSATLNELPNFEQHLVDSVLPITAKLSELMLLPYFRNALTESELAQFTKFKTDSLFPSEK